MPELPFLTSYDPPGDGEGSLDPLGLYQIADQLAVKLVPSVRERMQRIRFLTAMAVGALVTQDMEDDPRQRDASPYLVWEWHLAEALVRCKGAVSDIDGVPGSSVTARAIERHKYLDARGYLRNPRTFGFHGVYKRLATHMGVIGLNLEPRPTSEALVDAWARDLGLGGVRGAQDMIRRWRDMVAAGMRNAPPRTKSPKEGGWEELAKAFAPAGARHRERKALTNLLHDQGNNNLAALVPIWRIIAEAPDGIAEEDVHRRLARAERSLAPLITAIQNYEVFSRSLHDAFDALRAGASNSRSEAGFAITDVAKDGTFEDAVFGLHEKARSARQGLDDLGESGLAGMFGRRFAAFLEPLASGDIALLLCEHHETIQSAKSASGKRPWFDRPKEGRIYLRQSYRVEPRENMPGKYLHAYRATPIGRFLKDLA